MQAFIRSRSAAGSAGSSGRSILLRGHRLLSFLPRFVLLPPINLLLAALVCWLLAARYPRVGRIALGLCLLGLLILALPITPALMFAGLESGVRLNQPAMASLPQPQAIVILSGDIGYGDARGAIVSGARTGSLSLERIEAGALLHRQTGLPILVTGGVLRQGTLPIAEILAQSLREEFATPVRWVEPQAADTWGNAKFSAAMLAKDGITSVYVVTHPWHMRRALIAFAHFGVTAWPAPTYLPVFGKLDMGYFMPSANAWLDSYYAIHEWIGCAFYALRG
jgi:uncharacterized SAM-binding protein YcdF (DUF218 family)